MKLHERLRELRSERGLRLVDVGTMTNISKPYMSDIERGRTNPSLNTLQTLAKAYGITLKDLFEGIEFHGQNAERAVPKGLSELVTDPVYGIQITPDWIHTLSRLEHLGKRPRTKDSFLELFLHLRRILEGGS